MSELYIGDTPEQLGAIQAAEAIMIDGKIVTREDVRKLQSERDALSATVDALRREFQDARRTLQIIASCGADSTDAEIVDVVLDESRRWVSRYDESVLKLTPQQHLRDIRAEAVLSAVEFFKPSRDIDVEALASYAERVMAGE